MDAVKLIGHTCLLLHGENLHPADTMCFINHLSDVDPLWGGKRLLQIDFEALQLWDFPFFFIFLVAELVGSCQDRFGAGLNALAKTVVSVGNLVRSIPLVFFFWLQDQHFSIESRQGMSDKQIFALQLFNLAVFAKIDVARLWNYHFFFVELFVDFFEQLFVAGKRLAWLIVYFFIIFAL